MGSQSLVRDLEELTSLAFHMLRRVDMAQMEDERLRYAAGLFSMIRLMGDAIVRTHPEGDHYAPTGGPVWNPVAISVLNRALIEAYVDFHHLFIDDAATEEELEFRVVCAYLHCERDRLRRAELTQSRGLPLPQSEQEEQYARLGEAQRKALPSNEAFWKERLRANAFFRSLPMKNQKRLLEGRHDPRDRYRGTSCQPKPEERARRAGLRPFVCQELRSHLSEYVHAGPHAVRQLVFFDARDQVARQCQIDAPICISCGMIGLTACAFPRVFPGCTELLTAQVCRLIQHYAQVVAEDTSG